MNHFDDVANKILQTFITESTAQGEVVNINVPGTGLLSIHARVIKSDGNGESIYIADEDGEAGNIKRGQDITDLIASEDEELQAEEHKEENAEDPDLVGLGLDNKSLAAVNVAGKMATKAQGGLLAQDPQKKMNKAYGDLMNKISGKISTVASKIT